MPIEVKGLTHVYMPGTPFEAKALKDVSLSIHDGEFIGIIGHTGSGKSTLIVHLNGLERSEPGVVFVNGLDLGMKDTDLISIRRTVGLVFQYPEYQLFEETVFADIAFGPKNMGLGKEEIEERVREAAAFTGISEELFERSPLELSGGQKRRIAIAGVIAMRPEVLILDEPTAGLDPAGSSQIMANIRTVREKSGATVVIVSHNMDDAARYAGRLIVFDHGHVVMDGTPEEVFSRAAELRAIGLNVPKATELAEALRAQGIPLEGSVFTREQLLAAVADKKVST